MGVLDGLPLPGFVLALLSDPFYGPVLGVWFFLELLFWAACVQLRRKLDRINTPPPYPMPKRELMHRVLGLVKDLGDDYPFDRFLSDWFIRAPYEKLTVGSARSFFSWALYAHREEDLSKAESAELDELTVEAVAFAKAQGKPLKEGPKTEGIDHVDFTLRPLESVHRPLLWYAIVALKAKLSGAILLVNGFRRFEYDGLVYWHRDAADAGRPALDLEHPGHGRLPLVVFHGISSGIFLYLPMLLRYCGGRTAMIFEQPHISMALDLAPPSRDAVVAAVEGICRRHRVRRAAFLGHSFGSVPLAWMVDSGSSLVAQLLLLDPVSVMLAVPIVTLNFLYRRPRGLIQWLIYLAAASELGISYTLRRHFWWYQNALWLDKVPKGVPVVFGLAGADEVSPTAFIAKHALNVATRENRGDAFKVLYWEGHSHGQLLITKSHQDQVLEAAFAQEVKYLPALKEAGSVDAAVAKQLMPEVVLSS
uniref:AB hydrolase-1 domain-containing protein n=2 Tax=Phaeomonas parva TaxID=124430 RepID=A0A6U4GNQ7_9STRA|mmetsp:Transcript_27561/g.87244  ORF Transcript_27561/g.87244 Transcript_27561/m.87244 type:complete len:478 (+) Transcript_27561:224-1657(+)|eukprot:CAMPEP_0118885906 /NCGR_PEP_ID=MMETSP1163-20130328/24182_1 /TAXON_ID=124430 /ORGANISM="Phaeomonas parva, Strain CCMP2877" /LENGTH=477 /DNA_ID=CAMNT_0006823985 /DNA_START=149 /DNA_END=1582 /DNA_ORIENTATION=+